MKFIVAVLMLISLSTSLSLAVPTTTIYAVTFDGAKVAIRDLPSTALVGAEELVSGTLTQGSRHIRALSVQRGGSDICPFIKETKKLACLFATTCVTTSQKSQSINVWIPDEISKASLTIRTAQKRGRLIVTMELSEASEPNLKWEFSDLDDKKFVVFAFARKPLGPTPGSLHQASDLSDVIFLVVDFRRI